MNDAPLTVLIVDDSDVCSEGLAIALATVPNLQIQVVSRAQEALPILRSGTIAAVVTDLQIAQGDGFEFIQKIRMEPGSRDIPILVISGDSNADTPARVRRLGANAFFAKPYSPAAVRSTLERLLHAR